MTFNEYLEEVTKERVNKISRGLELNHILNTPIKNLDPKYSNLLFLKILEEGLKVFKKEIKSKEIIVRKKIYYI